MLDPCDSCSGLKIHPLGGFLSISSMRCVKCCSNASQCGRSIARYHDYKSDCLNRLGLDQMPRVTAKFRQLTDPFHLKRTLSYTASADRTCPVTELIYGCRVAHPFATRISLNRQRKGNRFLAQHCKIRQKILRRRSLTKVTKRCLRAFVTPSAPRETSLAPSTTE